MPEDNIRNNHAAVYRFEHLLDNGMSITSLNQARLFPDGKTNLQVLGGQPRRMPSVNSVRWSADA
ncbi:MAG: hypothetical protein IPI28_18010 [Candidatus Omnitrophica bacterium]|nr:hypothetical protein [Candidatus Omnitrophota bacterium]